jgi:hypothetical protein
MGYKLALTFILALKWALTFFYTIYWGWGVLIAGVLTNKTLRHHYMLWFDFYL